MKRKFTLLCTLTLVFLATINAHGQRQFDGSTMKAHDNLYLAPNQVLSSHNGHYQLVYQGDGNLCVYKFTGAPNCWSPIWATMTNGKSAGKTCMQGDGNFVVYDAKNAPIWATMTNGHTGAYLVMQDDGNLVIYEYGKAIWASGSNQ